ncbi:MAG: DNA starvation/stationary phase protection protein [Candidatus Protochlamydia sp.]|nr:DNA starvation/stationary phase protection protein [Candidatus Protochlamydia sp.]
MKEQKPTSPLAVPNNLGEGARDAITLAVNPLVADAFALYVKTKNFHWHLSGAHFRDYHLMFDEQANQIFAMIDILAERVRKLGGLTLHSIGQIGQLQTIKDDDDEFVEPKEMLLRLLNDNKKYSDNLRSAHQICEEHKDIATTSLLEVFMDETERRIWFLFEASNQ